MFLTETSTLDYDNLCRLDVLGLVDCAIGDQDEVYYSSKSNLNDETKRVGRKLTFHGMGTTHLYQATKQVNQAVKK